MTRENRRIARRPQRPKRRDRRNSNFHLSGPRVARCRPAVRAIEAQPVMGTSTTPLFVNIFVVVAAVAIVIQAAILVALYAAFKKTSVRVESLATRVESLAGDVQTRVLPAIDTVNSFLTTTRPKIETIIENLSS